MAYVILSDRAGEISRLPLTAGELLSVGRCDDCTAQVRDILLSRHHCRLEAAGAQWFLVDLHSRNGTFLNGVRIARALLAAGDVVRFGRSRMCFCEGELVAPDPSPHPSRGARRPADPFEALSKTVIGFCPADLDDVEETRIAHLPRPQPHPREPRSCSHGRVRSLVSALASKSWDHVPPATAANARRRLLSGSPKPREVGDESGNILDDCARRALARTHAVTALTATAIAIIFCIAIMVGGRLLR